MLLPSPYSSMACEGELNKAKGDDSEMSAGERGVRAATGREMSGKEEEGGRQRSPLRYRASSFVPASPVSAALAGAAGVAALRSFRELQI